MMNDLRLSGKSMPRRFLLATSQAWTDSACLDTIPISSESLDKLMGLPALRLAGIEGQSAGNRICAICKWDQRDQRESLFVQLIQANLIATLQSLIV